MKKRTTQWAESYKSHISNNSVYNSRQVDKTVATMRKRRDEDLRRTSFVKARMALLTIAQWGIVALLIARALYYLGGGV